MAKLYMGEQFWSDRTHYVTATAPKGNYRGREDFIQAVNLWMEQHNIKYEWSGESTHEQDSNITYQYHVRIVDPKQRTFFAVRWS